MELHSSNLLSSSASNNGEEELILPSGYRFPPHGNELIMHYLVNKIFGQQLPANIIRDTDLYAYDPHQLPISEFKYGKPSEAYFFTNLEIRERQRDSQEELPGLAIGKLLIEIFFGEPIVGLKKILIFYQGKAPKGIKTPWIMHEFRVNPLHIPAIELHNEIIKRKIESCVVCKILCKQEQVQQAFRSKTAQRAKPY